MKDWKFVVIFCGIYYILPALWPLGKHLYEKARGRE